MTEKNRVVGMNRKGLLVVSFSPLIPLLLVVDHTEAIPSIVVSGIDPDGSTETLESSVQFFYRDIFVTKESVAISTVTVHLRTKNE